VLVAGSAVGAACSSSNGSSNDFANRYCAELSPCCAAAGLPTDGATCRAFVSAYATSASFDASAADACVDETHAAVNGSAGCQGAEDDSATPSCAKVFASKSGTTAPGGTCTTDSDCAPASNGTVRCASIFVGTSSISKCQVDMVGKAGDSPCVGTKEGAVTSYVGTSSSDVPPQGYVCDVANGVFCDPTSGACKALANVGDSCADAQCVDAAYCDGTGKCVARIAVGASCAGGEDTCVTTAWCDPTSGVCATKLAQGQACSDNRACSSGDCTNEKCAPADAIGLAFICGS